MELKPCPFCGSANVFLQSGASRYVECRDCYADGPWNDYDELVAIAAWNTRANHARGEPVAWAYVNTEGECEEIGWGASFLATMAGDPGITPLYTHPPAQDVAALVSALSEARRIIAEIDDYMKRPGRGDWGEECACCMGELLDDDRHAIAKIDTALADWSKP